MNNYNADMQPDTNKVIQKLLQENATLTLVKAQLESLVEQYQDKEQAQSEQEEDKNNDN
ncbi:hypothetical protein [Leuconostoc mesenteroides]|uniref:hypothetical protein n=1 Tax=Leuconostoc mesenteroides TaxID=1245 RepID=UPI00235FC073|nr:hypothetical protein [Leuconostoc mesenteroides]